MVRQCPSCDLRFQAETELRDHLATDHGVVPELLAPFAYASRSGGTAPAEPVEEATTPPPAEPALRRYLLVANQTLGGEAVMDVVRERLQAGPCHFTALVPATRAADYPAGLGEVSSVWVPEPSSDQEAMAQARERVRTQLDRLRAAGADADGEIGDPDPLEAIRRSLEREPVDEIIISTLPARLSRWLRLDLPSRVERAFGLPVTVITARE